MEYINDIISQIITNFDFTYVIIVNILTYLIIVFIDMINKDKVVTTWQKRFILLISIIIITLIYYINDYTEYIKLINSAILAPVFWGWVLKPLFVKFNIDYKHIDKNMDNMND